MIKIQNLVYGIIVSILPWSMTRVFTEARSVTAQQPHDYAVLRLGNIIIFTDLSSSNIATSLVL
jgi:hypothetical protein